MLVIVIKENVQRSTSNVQHRISDGRDIALRCPDGAARRPYPTAAITFSSIAIGVGNAVTSIVVRVGFGLAGPAKYSA
jgi:hypothetical protein